MNGSPRWRLLASLALPPAAWLFFERLHGQGFALACTHPPHVALLGPAGIVVCGLGSALAWPFAAAEIEEPRARGDGFIAGVALGLAAAFALAIAYETLASVFNQACAG